MRVIVGEPDEHQILVVKLDDMRRRRVNDIRSVALVCLAGLGLALALAGLELAAAAPQAPAADFAPRLRAELGRYTVKGPTLVLDVTLAAGERRLARVTFVPPSRGLALPPPGQRVGDAAVVLASTIPGSRTPVVLAGDLRTIAPPAGCVRGARAALRATLAGAAPVRRLSLTMFVHEQRGSIRLTTCLPGQEQLGVRRVRRLSLRLERGVRAPTHGRVVWRALFTPGGSGSGAAASRSTTESQAIVAAGSFVTLQLDSAARLSPGSSLSLGGNLALGDQTAGRRVRLLGGSSVEALRVLARTRVGPLGTFRLRLKAPGRRGVLFLQARAPSRPISCRRRSADAPAGCTSATLAGVSSPVLRLRIR